MRLNQPATYKVVAVPDNRLVGHPAGDRQQLCYSAVRERDRKVVQRPAVETDVDNILRTSHCMRVGRLG